MHNSKLNISKLFKEEEVDDALSEGWIKGRGKELSETLSNAFKGKPTWNKGLTKQTDKRLEKLTGRHKLK